LVHSDIDLRNVIVACVTKDDASAGTAFLIDFGCARPASIHASYSGTLQTASSDVLVQLMSNSSSVSVRKVDDFLSVARMFSRYRVPTIFPEQNKGECLSKQAAKMQDFWQKVHDSFPSLNEMENDINTLIATNADITEDVLNKVAGRIVECLFFANDDTRSASTSTQPPKSHSPIKRDLAAATGCVSPTTDADIPGANVSTPIANRTRRARVPDFK
jgi:hypothetical protein